MIAIPSRPITVTASNLPGTDAIEYASGTYALNDLVKVTEITPGDATSYIGFIFQSLADENNTSPLDSGSSWEKVGFLAYEAERIYPENATVIEDGNIFISNEIDNDTSPRNTDSKWSFLEKDNKHACLDYYFTTESKRINGDWVEELEFSRADSLNLFGIYGSHIKVEQLDTDNNDAVIITNIIPYTDPATISDFATYLKFGSVGGIELSGADLGTQESSLVDTSSIRDFATYLQFIDCKEDSSFEMPLIKKASQKVRVTIKPRAYRSMQVASVATITAGSKIKIACTLWGIRSNRVAITQPTRDRWGYVNDTGDDYVKVYTGTMKIDTEDIDYTDYILDSLFNQPATYLLTDGNHKSFNTFGLMQSSELSLDNVTKSGMPLKIESFKYKKNTKEC